MMKLGISTLVDMDVPFAELAGLIAKAGFSHISLSHDVMHSGYHRPVSRREIIEVLAEHGLKLNYIHAPIRCYLDLTSPAPQVRRAALETVKMAILAARALDGNGVVVHLANDKQIDHDEFPERIEHGCTSVRELSACGADYGITVAFENQALSEDRGLLALKIINALWDWDGLALCLDTCHAWMVPKEARELVADLAPRVAITHFSDTMGREDSHLLPFEGTVDFAYVAQQLRQSGFDGVVDLECSLWMLRRRHEHKLLHPEDAMPCSTWHYLERAVDGARRIATELAKESA